LKYLTEQQAAWQSIDTYIVAKENLNKECYTKLWRDKYASRRSVGPCQEIARNTNAENYEEFFNAYLEYANSHLDESISRRGCTLDELEMVAYNWMMESGNPYELDFPTFYYGVVMHVIIETLMGKVKEKEVMDAFIKKGFTIEESDTDEDAIMGIDFKVLHDGKIRYLVQVKPASFVLGHKIDLIQDRRNVYNKHAFGHDKYPDTPYLYFFYNSKEGGKWLFDSVNKKYSFKYEDLVRPNGYAIRKKEDLLSEQRAEILL
jgi:hypothetical protein